MISQPIIKKNISSKQNRNMKKDFKQFFIESAGQSLVQQGEFEQIQSLESDSDKNGDDSQDNQFQEVDDQQPQGGIKSAQFWNGIKMISNAPPPCKDAVKWDLRCPMSFGFNSLGRDNIFYLGGYVCKAAGCLIIYRDKIYSKHSKKITTLAYNTNTQQLLSVTQSSSPQLFLWRFNHQKEQFQWVKRFSIGKKCEEVYAISFFRDDYVVAVERFTLHKSSNAHIFNKDSGKKVLSMKVGKFYDLELLIPSESQKSAQQSDEYKQPSSQERLFFANDEGVSELIFNEEQSTELFKAQRLHQSYALTCLCPFYDFQDSSKLQILYGDKDGNIQLIFEKKSLKVHQGWIFQIKHHVHNQINYFFTLGALDFNLSVIQYQETKLKVLHRIHLGGYGRSIQSQNDLLLIGKRDGGYQNFSIEQLIRQKDTTKITRTQSKSLKCFESREHCKTFLINRSNNKETQKKQFVYGNSGSRGITFFKIQENKLTDLKLYPLRSYPSNFDIKNNMIAYTYDIMNNEEQSRNSQAIQTITSMNSKALVKNEKQFQRSVLVVQDYSKKSLLVKILIKVQEQSKIKQKCTVIKFSPSGNYLALGSEYGKIYLLQVNEEASSSQLICSTMVNHKQSVNEIIWSRDQKYLKTIGMSELFYWQISQTKQQDLKRINLTNIKALQAKDMSWNSLGKFSWQVKNVWDQTSSVQQIYKFWSLTHTRVDIKETKATKEIESSKQQLIGCTLKDGRLKIYNYPANASKCQQFKLTSSQFQVCEFDHSNDRFSLLVVIEGILIVVELYK